MGRKSASGSGIPDEQPGSYFLELRNHFFGLKYLNKFFDADPGSGMEKSRIRESGINIPDPQQRLGCRCYVATVLGSVVQSQLSEGRHFTQCGRWAL